jgi:hypothetical protein
MRREADALLSVQRFFEQTLPEFTEVATELEEGADPQRPFAMVEQITPTSSDGAPRAQMVTMAITATLYLAKAPTRAAATDAALEMRERVWQAVKWGPNLRRPTTDRIPLFTFQARPEIHRLQVRATAGTFTVTITDPQDPALHVTTDPLPVDATAVQVAAAVGEALAAAETIAAPGDVVGHDRGRGLWDLAYDGGSAGRRIGEPSIASDDLQGWDTTVGARTLLEGAASPWRGPSDYMRVDDFTQATVFDPADPTLVTVPVDLRLMFLRGLPLPLDLRILQQILSNRQ